MAEREFVEWQVYWAVEPPLADRLELAIGILTSLMANINRDAKRRPEPFEPRDFMAHWDEEREAPAEDEEEDCMAPEKVLAVMERLREHQEKVGKQGVVRRS